MVRASHEAEIKWGMPVLERRPDAERDALEAQAHRLLEQIEQAEAGREEIPAWIGRLAERRIHAASAAKLRRLMTRARAQLDRRAWLPADAGAARAFSRDRISALVTRALAVWWRGRDKARQQAAKRAAPVDRSPAGRTLTVEVQGGTGTAPAVVVYDPARKHEPQRLTARDRFRVSGILPAGRKWVVVFFPPHTPLTFEVDLSADRTIRVQDPGGATVSFRGQVADAEGHPLRGVLVEVATQDRPLPDAWRRLRPLALGGPWFVDEDGRLKARTWSDGQGQFRLALPGKSCPERVLFELDEQRYERVLDAGAGSSMTIRLPVLAAAHDPEVDDLPGIGAAEAAAENLLGRIDEPQTPRRIPRWIRQLAAQTAGPEQRAALIKLAEEARRLLDLRVRLAPDARLARARARDRVSDLLARALALWGQLELKKRTTSGR